MLPDSLKESFFATFDGGYPVSCQVCVKKDDEGER